MRVNQLDQEAPASASPPSRVLTIPNLLSAVRLALLPLFLWLVLGPHADGWAVIVLVLISRARGTAGSAAPASLGVVFVPDR